MMTLYESSRRYVCTDGTFNVVMLESCVSSRAEI